MDKRMRALQEQIYACTAAHVETASTEELGEAVDMIKDLAEGIYYEQKAKLLTKELECLEKEEKKEHHYIYMPYYRDMDRDEGRMYFTPTPRDGRPSNMNRMARRDDPYRRTDEDYDNWDDRWDKEHEYPTEMRDRREGKSPIRRKYYMEAKELKHDKKTQMEELEKYMQELSKDITEMISDASPEETTLLKQKLVGLIEKIK